MVCFFDLIVFFFFFNDTATTEIYTLSLHDALPIYDQLYERAVGEAGSAQSLRITPLGETENHRYARNGVVHTLPFLDRKSTRLNSSHANISYAVFCLKKKNNKIDIIHT